jgi:beta-lactamase regulating signal transducer with metallopeptidase domain
MLLLALDVSLRVTAAAAAVGLILLAFRVRSGSVRHAAWSAVVVVMLTMPLLMAVVPEIEVPVPSTPALDFGTIASPAVVQIERAVTPEAPGATIPALRAVPGRLAVEGPRPATDWSGLAVLGYVVVASLFLLKIVVGWWLARRMMRTAAVTSLQNRCRIMESPLVAAPLTAGLVKTVIVLPVDWRAWPSSKLAAVLAHENAHIARRDPLISLIAQINRAVFWFHPLAWWLARTIAVSAEHACDERAVLAAGDARSYARVLLEFTEAVQARGGRVAWQGLGVDGTGLLGARIDRLLRGDAVARMSVLRRVTTALACAAVLIIAIACRQQVAATPLKEDPEVAKRLATQAEQTQKFQAAINLSSEQVDALEARVAASPGDWEAREQLVTFYSMGTTVPWERKLPGLRRHALWIIQNAPEGPVAAPVLSPQHDPDGFAEAQRLWDGHLAGDVSPLLIYRATRFFWPHDKVAAEALILRGRSVDPDGAGLRASLPPNVGPTSWDAQLAEVYGSALLGHTNPMIRSDAEPATSAVAQEFRRKLDASTDAELLARVAAYLTSMRVPKTVELGRHYLTRALAVDPASPRALAVKSRLEVRERQDRLAEAFRDPSTLSGGERLLFLARKAQQHYMRLEYYDFQLRNGARDQEPSGTPVDYAARIPEQKAAARDAAREVLATAEKHAAAPESGHAILAAHHTLGLLALREGDRDAAVRHMRDSTAAAPPVDGAEPSLLWVRLSNYLLKEGERESVIQFLEALAKISPANRDRILADAQAVREGRMPSSYQAMFARP